MPVKPPRAPERDAERLVRLLREEGSDPAEVRAALRSAPLDADALIQRLYDSLGEEDAKRFLARVLHKRSEAAQVAAAERKAWEVRRVIDDLRRRENGLKNSMLAERLNELRIAAPRGGEWSESQVYRVLKRTGGTQRPERKNRSGVCGEPPGKDRRAAAARENGEPPGNAANVLKPPPDENHMRMFISYLREDDSLRISEARDLIRRLLINTDILLFLAVDVADEDAAVRAANRMFRARSGAARVAKADARAQEVRKVIDAIRRDEGEIGAEAIARRLNGLGVPAPRGGEWTRPQVHRVLKRTDRPVAEPAA